VGFLSFKPAKVMLKGLLVFKGCFSPFGWLCVVIVVCRDKVSFKRVFAGG